MTTDISEIKKWLAEQSHMKGVWNVYDMVAACVERIEELEKMRTTAYTRELQEKFAKAVVEIMLLSEALVEERASIMYLGHEDHKKIGQFGEPRDYFVDGVKLSGLAVQDFCRIRAREKLKREGRIQ